VTIALLALTVGLATLLAALLWRERGRRRLAAALAESRHAREDVERRLRGAVAREELSAVIAARDALLHASEEPLLVFEPGGMLARANVAARDRLGVVPGRRLGELDAPPAIAAAVAEALAGEDPLPFAMTVPDPSRRHFQVHVRAFSTAAGRGCVVTLREDTLEADYRESRQLFSAGVSHELRTPLARMLGLVETLALPLGEDERDATIRQAQAEVEGMRRLVDEMILLAGLDVTATDGVDRPDRRADVAAEITAAISRHQRAAQEAGLELGGSSTRGLLAAIAPPLLATVMDNLVENAVRHAGAGATIHIAARGLAGAVEVTVADSGVGIPAEHIERIFERFYRADPARSGPGSGLGLALVKHVAEAHGGRASLHSVADKGVTVRIVLPTPASRRARARGRARASC
jgi:two-component system, OmpR family, phosphate regulon sensor histidine kinase PhoR